MHAISKMAAGCLQKLLFKFIVVPSVLCHVQGGSWVLAIYIYSCAICFMSKMAAGCLLFIFIVVSGVLSCVQDGSWAVGTGSRYLYL